MRSSIKPAGETRTTFLGDMFSSGVVSKLKSYVHRHDLQFVALNIAAMRALAGSNRFWDVSLSLAPAVAMTLMRSVESECIWLTLSYGFSQKMLIETEPAQRVNWFSNEFGAEARALASGYKKATAYLVAFPMSAMAVRTVFSHGTAASVRHASLEMLASASLLAPLWCRGVQGAHRWSNIANGTYALVPRPPRTEPSRKEPPPPSFSL